MAVRPAQLAQVSPGHGGGIGSISLRSSGGWRSRSIILVRNIATLRGGRSEWPTEYPESPKPIDRVWGRGTAMHPPDGTPRCVACNCCGRLPGLCIRIVAGDRDGRRRARGTPSGSTSTSSSVCLRPVCRGLPLRRDSYGHGEILRGGLRGAEANPRYPLPDDNHPEASAN